jgi:hypothetical protein
VLFVKDDGAIEFALRLRDDSEVADGSGLSDFVAE